MGGGVRRRTSARRLVRRLVRRRLLGRRLVGPVARQPGLTRAGTPVLCGSQGLRERRQPPAVVAWVVVSMEYVYRLSSGSLGNAVGISHGRVRSMEWDGAPLRRRRHPQIRRSEPTRRSPQQGLEFGPKRPYAQKLDDRGSLRTKEQSAIAPGAIAL